MPTSYSYGPGTYNTTQLQGEIVAAGGGPAALTGINGDGTIGNPSANIAIFYASALSGADKTALDALVAAHVAVALDGPQTIHLGTITTATPCMEMSAVWNNGAVQFFGLKIDIDTLGFSGGSAPLNIRVDTNVVTIDTLGKLVAPSFQGEGHLLSALNATNLTTGTVDVARLPWDLATQGNMESEATSVHVVTAGVLRYGPSACKGWCVFTVSGTTPTIAISYNVTSVTRKALGKYEIAWTNSFSSANYGAVCLARSDGAGYFTAQDNSNAQTAAHVSFQFFDDTGTLHEPTWATVLAFGDL